MGCHGKQDTNRLSVWHSGDVKASFNQASCLQLVFESCGQHENLLVTARHGVVCCHVLHNAAGNICGVPVPEADGSRVAQAIMARAKHPTASGTILQHQFGEPAVAARVL